MSEWGIACPACKSMRLILSGDVWLCFACDGVFLPKDLEGLTKDGN